MNGYVFVYRGPLFPNPSQREWAATQALAAKDRHLAKFLRDYRSDSCYYDWGDDPSFFAAEELASDDMRRFSRGVYLQHLIFEERETDRGLRTSRSGNAHPHINLVNYKGQSRPGRSLPKLRQALLNF